MGVSCRRWRAASRNQEPRALASADGVGRIGDPRCRRKAAFRAAGAYNGGDVPPPHQLRHGADRASDPRADGPPTPGDRRRLRESSGSRPAGSAGATTSSSRACSGPPCRWCRVTSRWGSSRRSGTGPPSGGESTSETASAVETMLACHHCGRCLGGDYHLCERRRIYSYIPLSDEPRPLGRLRPVHVPGSPLHRAPDRRQPPRLHRGDVQSARGPGSAGRSRSPAPSPAIRS